MQTRQGLKTLSTLLILSHEKMNLTLDLFIYLLDSFHYLLNELIIQKKAHI